MRDLADRAALNKWKRHYLDVNWWLRTGILSFDDGVQISARNVEASFDKPECDFFPKSLAPRCARNPAHLSAVRRSAGEFHTRPKRRIVQRN